MSHPIDGHTIRMGVLDYSVQVVPNLRAADDTKLYGEILYGAGTIRIDSASKPAFQAVVLWHELIHGLLEQAGQEQSESTCNALAYGLVQLFRDNPDLVERTLRLLDPARP